MLIVLRGNLSTGLFRLAWEYCTVASIYISPATSYAGAAFAIFTWEPALIMPAIVKGMGEGPTALEMIILAPY